MSMTLTAPIALRCRCVSLAGSVFMAAKIAAPRATAWSGSRMMGLRPNSLWTLSWRAGMREVPPTMKTSRSEELAMLLAASMSVHAFSACWISGRMAASNSALVIDILTGPCVSEIGRISVESRVLRECFGDSISNWERLQSTRSKPAPVFWVNFCPMIPSMAASMSAPPRRGTPSEKITRTSCPLTSTTVTSKVPPPMS